MKLRNIWKARKQKRKLAHQDNAPSAVIVEPLEPRVLLSADAISAVMPVEVDEPIVETDQQLADAIANLETTNQPLELVFVDTQVEGYEKIIADLTAQADRNFDIHIIDADGFKQVTEILAQSHDVSAVHIISHGDPGVIELGEARLDSSSFESYAADFADWAEALTAEADLLFYGCDVAGNSAGEALLEKLAQLTGADVAASNDLTGAAALGGDWELEYRSGEVQVQIAPSLQLRESLLTTLDITTGLVAHYEFDEGSGTTAVDSAGGDNTGTHTGTPTPVHTAGLIGSGALNFSGTDDDVTVADAANLDFGSGDFTVSLWYNTSNPTGTERLIGKNNGGSGGWLLYIDNFGDLNFGIDDGSNNVTFWTNGSFDSSWHHVAAVRDGNNFEIFIDGVSAATDSGVLGSVDNAEDILIGISNGSNFDYNGLMDDVRLYNRALTSSDIGELIALGTPDLVVDTTADYNNLDANYGDTSSVAALYADKGADNLISLREAIDAANNQGGHDTITFNIPGSGSQVINLSSLLPQITDAVTIDGTTQTDWVAGSFNPVVIDGNNLVGDGLYFTATADGSEVNGLVVRDFGDEAIDVDVGADNITITGNFLGAFDSGGLYVAGEELSGASIVVYGDNATIGGTSLAERNLIAGGANGVVMIGASGGTISGNYIGTDVTGNTTVSTTFDGVRLENGANNITIGGATTAHRNIIAGVGQDGVQITGEFSDNNTVQNNWIGVSADGTSKLGVGGDGVFIQDGADSTSILDNHIAGADVVGIELDTSGSAIIFTTIQGNIIGTDTTGTLNWGSGQNGILIEGNADSNTVGGLNAGDGNIIAFSGQLSSAFNAGIVIESGNTGNAIRGNSIYSNGGLGIDLSGTSTTDGRTQNDAGDADSGGNNLQNWPVLNAVSISDAGVMSYTVDTSSFASGTYEIDFYASTDRDGGQVEGARFLGTGGFVPWGNPAFNGFLGGVTLAPGEYVVATVTDASGNTSEFSNYAVVTDNDGDVGVTLTAPGDLQATATSEGGLSINSDGGNDTVLVADDGGTILGGLSQFTMEFQYEAPAITDPGQYTLASYLTPSDGDAFYLSVYKNGATEQVYLLINGSFTTLNVDADAIFDGGRHTISLTWDSTGGAWEFFLDGVSLGTQTGAASGQTLAAGGQLYIGMDMDSGDDTFTPANWGNFGGTLYDVRVFDDVRTNVEIAASYQSTLPFDEPNLVANWHFDDHSTDGVVTDAVNGNNLTLTHISGGGFAASEPALTFSIDENAVDGTVVGSVQAIDAEREALIASLLAADTDLRYNSETGKFYQVVGGTQLWGDAKTAAESTGLNGVNGQLATIRSANENEYVRALIDSTIGYDAWIGGTDSTVEGEWRWVENGSEADQFWQGDETGYNTGGAYHNFESGQPNDAGSNEDVIHMDETTGLWRDADHDTHNFYGYVIEWNADDVLDATQAITYSIQAQSAAGAFEIDADTGEIRVADGTLLDADTLATHTVTVRSTDVDSNIYDEAFTISLKNLVEDNNAPSDLSSGIELNTDGGNDAYLISNTGLSSSLTATTVEITFAANDVPTETVLMSFNNNATNDELSLQINDPTNDLEIDFGPGVAILASSIDYRAALVDGDLHTLSVSWDSTNGDWAVYIDGEFIESGTGFNAGATLDTTNGQFVFGQEQDGLDTGYDATQYFSGTYYDVRIWNEVRSEAEIALNYQHKFDSGSLPSGLLVNWQMDGFNGSSEVVDVVGANNLSISHATGTGFTTSTSVEDLHIIENAANGTSVGFVVPSDPDAPQDIVNDGLFLEGDNGTWQLYNTGESIGAWTVTDGRVDHTSQYESPLGGVGLELERGAGDPGGTISQTLTTEAGKQYQVIFAATGNFSGGDAVKYMRASADGVSHDYSITDTGVYEQFSFTFTASDTSTDLSFTGLRDTGFGAVISDVQVIEIPDAINTILNNDSTLSYDAGTGKFYKLVTAGTDITTAMSNAGADQLNGIGGQLVTIRSEYENDYIRELIAGQGSNFYIGATDATTEGAWNWIAIGAEADRFWNGGSGGSTPSGAYSNWHPGEPSESGGGEDYAAIRESDGLWLDLSGSGSNGYIVEWDASQVLSNYTFNLTDTAGGRFAIDTASGEITVADGSLLDYETNTSHNVTVEVTDAAGNTYSEAMTIQVDNLGPAIFGMTQDYLAELDSYNQLIHLRLGETSGTLAEDAAGPNDGTYQGTFTLGATGALSGDSDTAVTFNNNEYVEVPHDPDFLVDDGTIQLWFKTSNINQQGTLFSKDASGFVNGGHIKAEITTAGEIEVRLQSTTNSYTIRTDSVTQAISENEWHHFAFSFGSDGMKLYIDGQLMATDAYTGGLGASSGGSGNTETLVLGASNFQSTPGTTDNLQRYYEGEIDEFAILGEQLTDAQISSLANSADPAIAIDEDQTIVFSTANGNAISVSDGSSADTRLQVTLSVTNGTLRIPSPTGLAFVDGFNGDPSITIEGTEANINTSLEGLIYTPNADYFGADNLVVTTALNGDLEGYYTFEGGNANDQSAGFSTQDGTLVGDATITDIGGNRGEVLSLDGTGDYVEIASNFGTPNAITIGGWVNFTGVGRQEFISIDDHVHIALDDGGNGVKGSVQIGASSWNDLNSNTNLSGTGWHHIMYTYDDSANVHNLYIDGALAATETINDSIYWTGATNTYIGHHPDFGFNLNGQVDDARIYNRALSASEIAAIAADEPAVTESLAITINAVNDAPIFSDKTNAEVLQIALPDVQSVTAADLDNDGDADLIGATDTGDVVWFENDGTGAFGSGTVIGSAENFTAVEAFDLEGDGDLDIVAMNNDPADLGDSVYVFTNNFIGSGTVSFNTTSFEGPAPGDSDGGSDLAIGDIDGDGRADIVGTFYRSINDAQVVVFEQNTLGVWTKTFSDSVGNPYGIDLADMDGDGDLDIIAGEFQNKEIRWYENDGAPTAGFTRQTIYADSDLFPIDINFGDFDGDGDQDIVFASWGAVDEIAVLLNDGAVNPSFQYQSIYTPASGLLYHLDVADMNGDGDQDIIVTNRNTSISQADVLVLDNDGAANFSPRIIDDNAANVEWAEVADINGDGNLDIIAAPNSTNAIEIYSGHGGGFVVASVNEDVSFGGLHLEVSDDSGAGLIEVTINVVNGRVIIPTGSVTVLSGGSSTSFIRFEGTLADINTALNSFTYSPTANFTGLGELQVTVDDRGNTGGGALSVSETLYVVVEPVNDAPTISNLDGDILFIQNDGTPAVLDAAALATAADIDGPGDFDGGTLVINGMSFDALDVIGLDTGGTVSLSAGFINGSTVSVGGTGVGVLSGVTNSTATITLNTNAGTTEVSTLLQALTFSTTATVYGDRTVDVTFTDGDGTANGGADTASASMTVNVASATGGSVSAVEDTAYVYAASDFDFTGVATANIDSITITALPTSGTLTLNGTPVTVNQTISRADIDANLFQFIADSNENGFGYASFSFYVNNGISSIVALPAEPSSWTLDSTSLTDLDELLADPTNFGAAGTIPTVIQVADDTSTVDAAYLNSGDILFDGYVTDASYDAAELAAIDAWVSGGGVVISTNDSGSYDPIATHFGLTIGGSASSTWHVADDTHAIMNGPFGSVGNNGDPFSASGTISYFDSASLQVGDIVLATDSGSGEPTIVLRQYGSGAILFLSDEGPFRGNTTGGGAIVTPNDILAANVFAWAIGELDAQTTHQMSIDVSAVNDAPVGTNNTVSTLEDTDYTFAAADFGFSDPVEGDALGGIYITTIPTNGTLYVDADGDGIVDGGETVAATDTIALADITAGRLKFKPAADANGTGYDSFTFQVQDDGGTANGGVDTDQSANTMTIDVTAVNDAPAGTNNTVTTAEDTDYAFAAGDFGYSDAADSDTFTAVYITTIPTNGTLYIDSDGDGVVDGGEAVVATDTVALADITAGRLKFKPATNANGTGYDSFTFQVQDDGGTANGGVDTDQTPNTMTIDVTAVNDAPAGSNTTVSTAEDTDYVLAAGDFGFTDSADGDALTAVYITTAPTNGVLYVDANGDGIVDGGEAVAATDTVALADITAGRLKFKPANDANGSSYDSFTFQVQDDGGTANGGVDTDQTPNTITIDVTAVNDAPTVTLSSALPVEFTEQSPVGVDINMVLNDIDDSNLEGATIRIASGFEAGVDSLNFTPMFGITGSFVGDTLTLSGTATVAQYQQVLRTVAFYNSSDTPDTTQRAIEIVVGDGTDTSTPVSRLININPVNDAPAGTNNTVTTLEDTDYVFAAADFGFSDVDGDSLTAIDITTTPANGTLYIDTDSDGIVDVGEAVSPSDTIALADITAGRLKFKPVADANGTGYDSFTFQVQDDGGTASGGVDLDPTPNTITIDVTAVNDAPVNTVPGAVSGNEDTAIFFTGANQIQISDVDHGGSALRVQLNVGAGGLLTIGNTAGLSFSAGDGAADANMIFTGTLADINAALLTLRFDPTADFSGTVNFTITTNDQGNTGNDPGLSGDGASEQDSDGFVITINQVNDAPAGTNNTVTTLEDTDYTFAAGDFGFSDSVDGDALMGVYITTLPTNGTLYVDSDGDGIIDAGEAISATDTVAIADITAGRLKFKPAPDANGTGYDSFTFQVQDDGGTGNGGIDLDQTPNTMAIDVTSVNDVPTGANNTVTTLEDTDYTFAAGDFGFSDAADGDALTGVYITTLPTSGTLYVDTDGDGIVDVGDAVSATDTVAIADITAGRLKFKPAADANGTGYDSFTFQVQDDGGTANGGVDLDQTPNTMTIDVTSVNDAPAGTNNTVTTLEDTDYTFAAADFGFSDTADGDAVTGVYITTIPTNGTLYVDIDGDGISDVGEAVSATDTLAIADITAGRLKFKPAPDANGTGYDSFTFQVQDDGGTGNGGIDLDQTPNTMTIDVTSVNDAPAGTNNTVTTLEDTDYTFAAGDFGFSDSADGDALTGVYITTLPTNGTLYVDTDGDGIVDVGEAVSATDTIAVADITAGRLKFKPAADANGTGYDSFTFQVQDDGGTANGGVDLDQTPNTMTIDVTNVNDAPAGTNNTVTTLEDTDYTFAAGDFGFSDSADGDALAGVYITTLPANGTLYVDTDGDGIVDVGEAVSATDTIAVADITAGRLKFKPAADENGTGYDSFTFQVQDDGGTANGGLALDQTPNTMTIDVTSVNDAPAGTNNTVTTLEDTDYTFAAGDFGFSDTADGDALTGVYIATLPTNGTLYVDANGDGIVDIGEAVSATDTIALAEITAGRLKFKPAADANGTGYDSFTFQVQDDGGTANGGVDLDQTPNTMTIDVTSVNDAPAGTNNTVASLEDTDYTFAVGDFGYSDIVEGDSFASIIVATVPANGSLYLDTNANGVVDGGELLGATDSVSIADISAGRLKFKPATDGAGTGYDSFAFQVQDDGGTANGGIDTDQSPNTITIDVTPINDAPVRLTGTVANLTVNEDSGLNSLGLGAVTYGPGGGADEAGQTLTYNVTVIPDPVAFGKIFLADGTTQVTVGTYTLAQIQGMQFSPEPDVIGGPAFFSYQIVDNGGTANGGIDTLGETIEINITPVNDSDPVAVDDSITLSEGATATVLDSTATSVLANDTDADLPFDSLSVTLGTGPSFASSFTLNADGTFSYTHDGTENFTDSFTYIVSDADGGVTDTGTVTITINPVNDNDPVANGDSITLNEGATATVLDSTATSVLTNDTDVDLPNDTLTVTVGTGPSFASAFTLNTDGTFSYTHDGTENFTDSFTYIVSDANGGVTDTGTVTININPVNDNDPVANNDSITLNEGATATILDSTATSVLANDTDVDLPNDTLTVTVDTGPNFASAFTLNADGTFSYTHDGTENFTDSFTYIVSDANGGVTDTGTVTININPVNDNDPVANNDSITVNEGATATVLDSTATSVLANDTDVDLPNDTLTVTVDTSPSFASAFTLNADGTFSYTHDGTENFTDSFTYIVSDANGGVTDTGTVTININPVNDNDPLANNDSITVNEGATATVLDSAATSVLANDTDVDLPNDTLTVTVDTGPSFASAFTLNADGTFSYTHDGTENFTDSFTYVVSDANGGVTDTGTVTININPVNDNDPVANNDSITVNEGATATVLDSTATSVLANDTDVDLPNDTLTVTVDTGPSFASAFTLNADGTFSYTHDGTENFTDSFTYIVADANGGVTDTGTVTININPVNDNDPVANNDSITLNEGATATILDSTATSVLANDTDVDLPNDTLTVTVDTGPSFASAFTLNADGTFSYTHDGTENFTDSFTYIVSDANGGVTDTGTVTININPVNDNDPVANNDSITLNEGATATVLDSAATSVLTNDTDVDLPNDTLTVTVDTGPSFASAFTLNADGTFSYTHDGTENFTDSFTYIVSDANGGVTDTGTVTININPVNDNDPVANNDSITVNEGATATILDSAATSVLANDTDVDLPNDTLTVTVDTGPSFASAFTLNADGTFSYTHDGTENFTDSFTYIVSDANGGVTDTGTVTININPVNDNDPVANNDSITLNEGATATVLDSAAASVLANDTDVDLPNDTLTVTVDTGPNFASAFTLNADGTFSYTHDGTENFTDSFTYIVSDANGGVMDTGTVTININPVNDNDPVANNDSITLNEGATATVLDSAATSVLSNDTDVDLPNDALTVTLASGPNFASAFTLNADGTFSYTHDGTENFTDSFTYIVSDANGGVTDTGTVSITINPVNDNDPVANNDVINISNGASTMTLDSGATNVLVNDVDLDLPYDTLTVSLVSGPSAAASFVLNADGTFFYAHDGSASTTDAFTYEVTDANGGITDTATVSINISNLNSAPVISSNGGGASASITVPSNQSFVTNVTASDIDGDVVTFSLSGPDAGKFSINPNSGALTLLDPSIADTYTIDVAATDPNGASDMQRLTVVAEGAPIVLPPPVDPPPGPTGDPNDPVDVDGPDSPSNIPTNSEEPAESEDSSDADADQTPDLQLIKVQKVALTDFTNQYPGRYADYGSDGQYNDDDDGKGQNLDTNVWDRNAMLNSMAVEIDLVTADMIERVNQASYLEVNSRRSVEMVSLVAIAGLMNILLKGSGLLGAAVTAMPLWRWMDPMPILDSDSEDRKRFEEARKEGDVYEQQIDDMLKQQSSVEDRIS